MNSKVADALASFIALLMYARAPGISILPEATEVLFKPIVSVYQWRPNVAKVARISGML